MTAKTSRQPSNTVGESNVVYVTLSLDTSAYSTGDVLADTQVMTDFMRVEGGTAVIQSLTVIDKDDQGVEMDVFISRNSATLGTENSAPSISDSNAEDIHRVCNVASTDYIDLGGVKVATKTGIGLVVKAAAGSADMYVSAITRGSPTYSASGVVLKFGILLD